VRKKKLKDTSVPLWLEAADEAHAADDKNMLDVQKAESGLIMIMYSRSSTHTQDSFIRIQAGGAD
jgi:aspartate carbamoyltransferase catalytic subunit